MKRRPHVTAMSFVVALAVTAGLAFPGAAFADETPPPADGGGEPAVPGTPTGSTGAGDVTDLPALPSGDPPPMVPSEPVGESWPIGPFPGTEIGDSSTAPNAPGPWPLLLSPESIAVRDALRAQLAAKYGSVEAGASAEGIDPATLEVSGSSAVAPAVPPAVLRAAETFRIAQTLHLLVPKAWSTWAGRATTLWIM